MMSLKTFATITAGATLAVLMACGGGGGGSKSSPTVYVAGRCNYIEYNNDNAGWVHGATQWINGSRIILDTRPDESGGEPADHAFARSIFVSGNDVYVAGNTGLWKNGVKQTISNPGEYTSVCASGNSVYLVGTYTTSGRTRAAMWKDGIRTELTTEEPNIDSYADSVHVSGNDVYVAGYVGGGNTRAVLWINGIYSQVGDYGTTGSSVFVSDSKVYVAGMHNTGGRSRATLWTDGVQQYLNNEPSNGGSAANSVYVSAGKVHVAGTETWREQNTSKTRARLWIDGISQDLEYASDGSAANSVYVSGDDVYVAGSESAPNYQNAAYWKNGKMFRLTRNWTASYSMGADAFSIFIK